MQELQERLMAMLSSGGAQAPSLSALLEQNASQNPELAAVLRLFAGNAPDAEAADEEPERPRAAREARAARIREQLGAMRDELERRRAICDELAAALGACACWGDEPACAECGGRGRPGCFVPDRRAFGAWITPAIERLRRRARPHTSLDEEQQGERT
jgi:hypothetical protein